MNRRMRNRTSGGVGGRRGKPRLLPDHSSPPHGLRSISRLVRLFLPEQTPMNRGAISCNVFFRWLSRRSSCWLRQPPPRCSANPSPVPAKRSILLRQPAPAVHGGQAEFDRFDRELLGAPTHGGRARAKARGVKMGRKPKLTPHRICEAIKHRDTKGRQDQSLRQAA
jgi:hypothetical protein